MKNFKYILFALVLKANIFNCKAQLPPSDPAYAITFGDDFNDTTGYFGNNIDTSKWLTRPPWNIGSPKVTLQYKDAANITKYDTLEVPGYDLFYPKDTNNIHVIPGTPGVCRLITRKGSYASQYWDFGTPPYFFNHSFKYSKGALCSKRLLRYGFYEIKFRLPALPPPDTAHSFMPTCWLYEQNYPRAPIPAGHNEIDIFEIDMSEPNRYDYTSSLYYSNKSTVNDTLDIADHQTKIANVSPNLWHTGSVFWDQDSIAFFYDGFKTRVEKNVVFGPTNNYSWHGDSLWPMRTFIESYTPNGLMYQFYHQVAGLPHPQRADTAQMQFPFVYEIDYYNVWQLKTDCSNNKIYLNTTTATFNSQLYKSLTIGGIGGNCDFTGSGKASALGVDYVLLDEGTAVGTSTEFYANILKCPENANIYVNKIEPAPPGIMKPNPK